MLPFLFTTLKRRLGTEDTKWWSVSGVILSHSSCKQVLRWATVRVFVVTFCTSKCATYSLLETGRDCRQASQVPVPSSSAARTCNVCSMWFCIVLLKYAWTSLERCLLEGSILCSKISMYVSALMVPSQKCKLPLQGHDTTPHHDRPWLWTCCW